jgi:hypothetical protein
MLKIIVFATLISFLSASAFAGAIGAFGSYWDSEDAGESYGYGLRLASTSDPAGFLELRVSRFDNFEDDDKGSYSGLDVIPIDIGMTLNMTPADSLQFYIGGGGSYYMMESEIETASGKHELDIDDEWGCYGLAGIKLELSPSLHLFAEGVYRQVEGTFPNDKLEDVDSDVDFKLDGWGANAGILLMF